MVTGVKISELVEATNILQTALVEIAQSGDNFKVPYSLLVPIISGIGRASVSAAANTLTSFNDFTLGNIVTVEGTNLEVTTVDGPDTGLTDSDLVNWHVFTFGTDEEKVQLAFSTYADSQQMQIRYGNIYSDSTWSAWEYIGADGQRYLARVQTRDQGIYTATYSATPGANVDDPIDPLTLTVTAKPGQIAVELEFNIMYSGGWYEGCFVVYKDGVVLPDSVDASNNGWSCIVGHTQGTVHTSWVPSSVTVKIFDDAPEINVAAVYEVRLRASWGSTVANLNYSGTTPQGSVESGMSTATAKGVYS
jgi:hypothetical protein